MTNISYFPGRDSFAELVRTLESTLFAIRGEGLTPWTNIFEGFTRRARALQELGASAEMRYQFACEVESMFGGLGSFDSAFQADRWSAVLSNLENAISSVLRDGWRELGKPVHSIPPSEHFEVGQFVRLIPGEIISMSRLGPGRKAPASPLIYRVVARIANDLDGMPRYHLESESRGWIARHNAIRIANDKPVNPEVRMPRGDYRLAS